jgi:hypothetical protein
VSDTKTKKKPFCFTTLVESGSGCSECDWRWTKKEKLDPREAVFAHMEATGHVVYVQDLTTRRYVKDRETFRAKNLGIR